MAGGQHEGHLGAVYGASGAEDVARIYDNWALTYDAEMSTAGYRHPTIGLALLSRHLPRGAGPVLDAGCGTGLIGEWLAIMGYPQAEGLDLSEGMLAVAAAKKTYRVLHRLALGGPLPFADHAFAAIISVGVFTTGHVGAEALPELIRICKPGGVMVLTVKTTLWEGGFRASIDTLAAAGHVRIAEITAPYVSMPGETGTVPSLALVLNVL